MTVFTHSGYGDVHSEHQEEVSCLQNPNTCFLVSVSTKLIVYKNPVVSSHIASPDYIAVFTNTGHI